MPGNGSGVGPQATGAPTAVDRSTSAAVRFGMEAERAAGQINAGDLKQWIRTLSSDEYGGRGPGSDGDSKTRAYLAAELAALGYAPGTKSGTWDQSFELVAIESAQPPTWRFRTAGGTVDLEQNQEFIVAGGVQAPRSVIDNAELVFVGYGIQAPEYQWDDFKDVDVRGKVLVMLNNDPDWDETLFEGRRRLYYGRWTYKYESAARQGAAGAIIIHTTSSAGYPFQVVQTSWTGPQFELPAGEEPRLQVTAWTTERATRTLLAHAGHELDALMAQARTREFRPIPLGITTSIAFDNQLTRVRSGNVLGLLRGSDPELAQEVVIYTAHHDHLGTATADQVNDNGAHDHIYNGALDNASGVATVLAVAKAFRALPAAPKRSILIAMVGAEEQGLLGSKYYAQYPTFAPGRIAANINVDGANIWGPTHDVTYIGMGKSTLDQVAMQAAAFQGRTVKPEQFPDRGYYYRSDQFSLARIGVPALYFGTGSEFIGRAPEWGRAQIEAYTAQDYHQPSDELTENWNFAGMVQDAQLAFWAGMIVADAAEMPAWNAGDEFAPARARALSELNQ